MNIGEINTLTVSHHTPQGMYVKDNLENVILVPKRYVTAEFPADTELDFFVYKDSEDRPVATTEVPHLYVNQAGFLTIKQKTKFGYFLDWGIAKDVLLPNSESSPDLQEGKEILVYLYEDKATNRIVATSNIRKFIKNTILSIEEKDEVNCLIYDKNEIGYLAVINHKHFGILYFTEVFRKIKRGEQLIAYVRKIREDQKVDLVLQKPGFQALETETTVMIYEKLKREKTIPLHDGSSPADIYAVLGISKKTFKKAVGILYKEKKVVLTGFSIEINQEIGD